MKKPVVYLIVIAVVGLVGYKSVYFEKLSTRVSAPGEKFDAAAFSKRLWAERMPAKIDSAVALPELINAIAANKDAALSNYSNALGIGNYRYTLIKTQAIVTAVNADDVSVNMPVADSLLPAIIATEFIYGNSIRDASKLIDINDFTNTADLNSVSEELNKIVRSTVLPEFRGQVKPGDTLSVVAAVEINKEHIKWNNLELIPVRIKILN
jgi:predicted lipoprotein